MSEKLKPQPKQEVAIHNISKDKFYIEFYATKDAVDEFREFGSISKMMSQRDGYTLFIDKRYDFDEVLAYIQSYG